MTTITPDQAQQHIGVERRQLLVRYPALAGRGPLQLGRDAERR